MKTVILNWKIKFERLRNTLDEFQMNELKAKLNAEIKIIEVTEKQRTNKYKKHGKIKT